VLWLGGAIFQALPDQNTGTDVAGAINSGAPGWPGRLDASVAGWSTRHGTLVVVALVVAEALIGLGALYRRTRVPAVAAGFVLALAIWVVGQDFGLLYTGQATDPNTAIIIALMATVILGGVLAPAGERVRVRRLQESPSSGSAGSRRWVGGAAVASVLPSRLLSSKWQGPGDPPSVT
jgi:hypothetical protein